jgi:hypothetical protein
MLAIELELTVLLVPLMNDEVLSVDSLTDFSHHGGGLSSSPWGILCQLLINSGAQGHAGLLMPSKGHQTRKGARCMDSHKP